MSAYFDVSDNDFDSKVLKSELPVLVDFWAVWCAPCRMINKSISEIADEYSGKIKVAKLDVDINPDTAGNLHITNMPTLMIFKNGEPINKIIGAVPKSKIIELIEGVL